MFKLFEKKKKKIEKPVLSATLDLSRGHVDALC